MTPAHAVTLVGFGTFEREALAAYLHLMAGRTPAYVVADSPAPAGLWVVNTDPAGFAQQACQAGHIDRAVFVGTNPPPDGAAAWLPRPFDPSALLRELDVRVALLAADEAPVPPQPAPPARPPAGPAPTPVAPVSLADLPVLTSAIDELAPRQAAPKLPEGRRLGGTAPAVGTDAPAVLIVDAADAASRSIERQLLDLDLATLRATDLRQACALLARWPFRMVLVDADMDDTGELDGLGLCQRIKRDHIHLGEQPPAVVLLSAHPSALMKVRSELAGGDGFLAKPLDGTDLRALLRRHGLIA